MDATSISAQEALRGRLAAVRGRIEAAAARVGRDPASVRLVAVTKGHDAAAPRAALDAGCVDVGENYVQELVAKMDALAAPNARWHLIGPLQRNKVKYVVGRVVLIHTVDSAALADALDARAAALRVTQDVLCQVNVGEEPQKYGVPTGGLFPLLEHLRGKRHLRVVGLMTLPPFFDAPERVRPFFSALRGLQEGARTAFPELPLGELSMGMSGDFEVAVEEGATLVRVGTTLFGARAPKGKD